jgi:hypothetical protein
LEHHKLDSIDLKILAELQADGRITNVELSRRAKITAPPCLRRKRPDTFRVITPILTPSLSASK